MKEILQSWSKNPKLKWIIVYPNLLLCTQSCRAFENIIHSYLIKHSRHKTFTENVHGGYVLFVSAGQALVGIGADHIMVIGRYNKQQETWMNEILRMRFIQPNGEFIRKLKE